MSYQVYEKEDFYEVSGPICNEWIPVDVCGRIEAIESGSLKRECRSTFSCDACGGGDAPIALPMRCLASGGYATGEQCLFGESTGCNGKIIGVGYRYVEGPYGPIELPGALKDYCENSGEVWSIEKVHGYGVCDQTVDPVTWSVFENERDAEEYANEMNVESEV